MSILAHHTAADPPHNSNRPPVASQNGKQDDIFSGIPSVQRQPASRTSQNRPEFTAEQIDDILNKRYEMNKLKSYDPWGKPGNGAPVADNHKRKFTERDLKEDLRPGDIGGMQFYTPGGGAPLRSPSGRLRAEVSGSEDIRHQGVSRGRDPVETFRYRKDQDTINQYRSDLDKIQRERVEVEEQQRYNDLKADWESLQYDSFGRPGAGAPNTGTNYGSMNASKRYRDVFRDVPKQTTLGIGPMRGNGAPLENERTGERKTKLLTTLDYKKDGERRILDEMPGGSRNNRDTSDNIFHPFGSPGGGNPNCDKNGNRIAIIPGASTVNSKTSPNRDAEEEMRKTLAAQEYSLELKKGMIERDLNRRREMQTMRSPTENLADKMLAAQAGKPRRNPYTGQLAAQHLNSTDVTHYSNISPRNTQAYAQHQVGPQSEYYTELERQCEARKVQDQLKKKQDEWEGIRHDFYRNFGHGASSDNFKKQNFLKILNHPDAEKNEYKKEVQHTTPVVNTRYVRNNTGSYHATAYELPKPGPHNRYLTRPPYASHMD